MVGIGVVRHRERGPVSQYEPSYFDSDHHPDRPSYLFKSSVSMDNRAVEQRSEVKQSTSRKTTPNHPQFVRPTPMRCCFAWDGGEEMRDQ